MTKAERIQAIERIINKVDPPINSTHEESQKKLATAIEEAISIDDIYDDVTDRTISANKEVIKIEDSKN